MVISKENIVGVRQQTDAVINSASQRILSKAIITRLKPKGETGCPTFERVAMTINKVPIHKPKIHSNQFTV